MTIHGSCAGCGHPLHDANVCPVTVWKKARGGWTLRDGNVKLQAYTCKCEFSRPKGEES